ncbi:hypothetical protein QBC44DRAFT_115417 [Cladorrhinum sp. PSN332]|nr:hypothetical protein QBC44DRAFT_115417 [Cladorrhinum sp. PSN332]
MAPIRRYLRITKYSVLETRIYLDNPSLTYSWLLNPRDPILPKVIEAVRPLVLPKLREERERERIKKKNKKKAIKDVVTEDEFEVSIFLTETETRHSLLHKQKHFRTKVQTKLTSNSSKLTGGGQSQDDAPIDLDAYHDIGGDDDVPNLRMEEEEEEGYDDDHVYLKDIPAIDETATIIADTEAGSSSKRGAKRRRGTGSGGSEDNDVMEIVDSDEDEEGEEDGLFVDSGDDAPPPTKRRKDQEPAADNDKDNDKKKTAMDISYEGFAIYGRVLCLVVKRREGKGKAVVGRAGVSGGGKPEGQAMMENWISSTQVPVDQGGEDAGDD